MKMLLTACIALASLTTYAQEGTKGPMPQSAPDQHAGGVEMRGDHAMGFSLENAKHHFELLSDGGIIQVEAKGTSDFVTRHEIGCT